MRRSEKRTTGVMIMLQMNVIAAFTDEGRLPHGLAEDVGGFVRYSAREQGFDGAVGIDRQGRFERGPTFYPGFCATKTIALSPIIP